MGVRLRFIRLSKVFASIERTRLAQNGASHWACTSIDSPRRMASQPPWTETRRVNEARARSRARGRSYGFSEAKSGISSEAATDEEAETSDALVPACIMEATNRQIRCASLLS